MIAKFMGDDRHQGEIYMDCINMVENKNDYEMFENILMNKLEQGAKEHKLVNVDYFRNIGKSYTLARFADKHNYIFVTSIYKQDDNKYHVFYYSLVDNQVKCNEQFYDSKTISKNNFVVDENFSCPEVDDKINIITGYCHKDKFEEYFNGAVDDTLKNEIKCLVPKIESARKADNIGTYKNLILAFKEVLELLDNRK